MSRYFIFDAVHTILRPVPDVMSTYFLAGQKFGSQVSRDDVKQRFRKARRRLFGTDIPAEQTQPGSLPSSDEREYQLWKDLVTEVFADVRPIDSMFEGLWEHFASPESWQLFDDVEACWQRLRQSGGRLVIASNFDSRLHEIVARHSAIAIADAVFCSAEVGYRKPDPMFYEAVADSLGLTKADKVTMVGDDFENDCAAPHKFGWQAYHLDRRHGVELSKHMISSLSQLS